MGSVSHQTAFSLGFDQQEGRVTRTIEHLIRFRGQNPRIGITASPPVIGVYSFDRLFDLEQVTLINSFVSL